MLLVAAIAGDRSVQAAGRAGGKSATPAPPQFSAERLKRVFRSDQDGPKFRAAREVEAHHLAHPDLPAALWEPIRFVLEGRRPVTPGAMAAVRLYGEIDNAEILERQLKLLAHNDIRLAVAVADGLATRQSPDALEPILDLANRPEFQRAYSVRHAVLWSVARYVHPRAIDWLLDILERSNGQLKYEAARQLARLTGKNFGANLQEWSEWWSDERPRYADAHPGGKGIAPIDQFDATLEVPWNEPVPRFFNLPIYARRVLLLVDRSGSMLQGTDGWSRLAGAKLEIERAVYDLPQTVSFNVLAFDSKLRLWQKHCVPATIQNKASSLVFMYRMLAGSSTSLHDGLQAAVTIEHDVELVIVLSDGEPTTGIVDPTQIVQQVGITNVLHRVTIHAVGMMPRPGGLALLRRLAETNFGACRTWPFEN